MDLDFRDANLETPSYAIAAGNAAIAFRDWYYKPYSHKKNLRGDMPPRKSLAWKQYIARRKAQFRSRTSRARTTRRKPTTFVPRPVYTRRRRYTRRRYSRTMFGTKGITVFQKNSYLIDHSITKEGYDSASNYFAGYYTPAIDSSVPAPWPIPLGTPGTTENWYVYGRLSSPLSKHISSANMASQFTKVKVNRITHTFNFPDQAAATTNDKWPLVIWVNQGDKWRVNIDGFGDATEWATADQLLERPGWKKFVVKRMTKLSISYTPTCSDD